MNPRYGDHDTYHMAASAIDEALRNCVAVGANPARIAILDNFCWAGTERPEELGSLVRAALACRDLATALGTPFISGKDSLNNEFHYTSDSGETRTISIPPSLLISALGQIDDVAQAVTMDLKEAGNVLYQIGLTKDELGGSHYCLVESLTGGHVPQVDPIAAKQTFAALHAAIHAGLVRSCHDLSEGGLAVTIAEMAFAGGLGARIHLADVPRDVDLDTAVVNENSAATAALKLLFSESNTRFLCEVPRDSAKKFETVLVGVPCSKIGEVTNTDRLEISGISASSAEQAATENPLVINAPLAQLKQDWQAPLKW
jgi:phosphoribosylformylglycinamidine synthase